MVKLDTEFFARCRDDMIMTPHIWYVAFRHTIRIGYGAYRLGYGAHQRCRGKRVYRIHRRIIFAFYIHIKTYIWSVVLIRFLPFFTHTLSALRQTRDTNNN